MTPRVYCSEVAKEAGAQLAGTAVEVHVWLLIEYPRPWKPKALVENDLGDAINEHLEGITLAALQNGVKLRIQFIKQGSSTDREQPLVYLADGRGHPRQLQGTLKTYKDLLTLTVEHITDFGLPEPFTPEPSNESLLLVCTNGQRDLCCARFGLPLFESLRMEFDRRAWQTTHIGGHRYAPNLLCLPSGLVYGHVAPESSPVLVEQHDKGQMSLAHLRGRSCLAPAEQAAEVFIRQDLLAGASEGELRMKSEDMRITFDYLNEGSRRSGFVELTASELPLVLASCGKAPKPDQQFELTQAHID